MQQWLARRADSSGGRLALQWFRRYFEASHNSGSAATIYMFLGVGPLLLAAVGLFHAAGLNTNAFARRLIKHHHLSAHTARLVSETFATASQNAHAASAVAVIGFLLWGISIGAGAGGLRQSGWAAVVPVWLVVSTAFWLWTPRLLLHGQIGLRELVPGALLASVLIGGATTLSAGGSSWQRSR